MKGTEKQISWATDILRGFTGTNRKDLIVAFQSAGKEKVVEAGICGPADMSGFIAKCNELVKSADAAWIIDNKNFLGLAAAQKILG